MNAMTPEAWLLGDELSPEAQAAVDRAEKLFRVAGRNPEEAATYIAKAQEILAAFNLDMSAVEQHAAGDNGKRLDEKLKGGYFTYQRDLWRAVAELNFCLYWSQANIIRTGKWIPNGQGGFKRAFTRKLEHQHRIVGRQVNVRMTVTMAQYLEAAIDRVLRERISEDSSQFRDKWATSFREGCVDTITDKLYERRAEIVSEQQAKQREREKAAHDAGSAGASTATGLTLYDVAKQEKEANLDFLFGDGYCARKAKEEAERHARIAEANRKADEAWTRYCEEHPEEAKKAIEEERKRQRKNAMARQRRGSSYRREPTYKGDYGAFKAGREAARSISIDPQAGGRSKPAGVLG